MRFTKIVVSLLIFTSLGCATSKVRSPQGDFPVGRDLAKKCSHWTYSNNSPIRWAKLPVIFYLDDSIPVGARPAIHAAAQQWNALLGKRVIRIISAYHHKDFEANKNVIYWNRGPLPNNPLTLAYTHTYWAPPIFIKADILLFSRNGEISYKHSRPGDLISIMLHEFGHSLDLGHTHRGLMAPSSDLTIDDRFIDEKSIDAVECLYPEEFSN